MRNKKLRICLAALVVFLTGGSAFALELIHVDADAPGAGDGLSWAGAYRHVQNALADARPASKPVEIRIAQGVYTPDSNSSEPEGTGLRAATFALINGVSIKGGYAGFGEANPNARDTVLYETIFSGDLDGNDIGFSNNAENSYHVVTGS